MARRMADAGFRRDQLERRDDEHVAAVNELVDALRSQHAPARTPYVAPLHGGREARVLVLLGAPGAGDAAGAAELLSVEDDDAGAERLARLLDAAGIDPWLVLPWHAVLTPLPAGEPPSATAVKAGRAALASLVPLLPRLRSVVLHGKEAEAVWSAYAVANPSALHGVRVEPVTFATSDEALSKHRASRERRLAATYASVAEALR